MTRHCQGHPKHTLHNPSGHLQTPISHVGMILTQSCAHARLLQEGCCDTWPAVIQYALCDLVNQCALRVRMRWAYNASCLCANSWCLASKQVKHDRAWSRLPHASSASIQLHAKHTDLLSSPCVFALKFMFCTLYCPLQEVSVMQC